MNNQICSVNGEPVKANDVIDFMKVTGAYHDARRAVVMNEVIRDHALHSGMTIDDDALQVYSDLRRMQLGLHSAGDMQKYLDGLGVSLDEWEEVLENELFRQKVKSQYGENIYMFDAWRLIRGIPEVRQHMAEAISSHANKKGIDVSEEEMQRVSDTFRRLMGMHSADEFRAILGSLRMDEDDWEKNVHANVSLGKMEAGEVDEIIRGEVKTALGKYPVLNNMITDMIFGSIIHAKAKKHDIKISDDELQQFSDNFRRTMKLHSAKSFSVWLQATGLTGEEFEFLMETELLKRKFADKDIKLFDPEKIDHYIKASEHFTHSFNKFKQMAGLKKIAEQDGISLTDKDLEEESNTIRRLKGMHKKDDFSRWLETHHLGMDEWEKYCEYAAYIQKLYDKETTIDKIDSHLKAGDNYATAIKNITFDRYANQMLGQLEVKL